MRLSFAEETNEESPAAESRCLSLGFAESLRDSGDLHSCENLGKHVSGTVVLG
jgi:hypothetical protein